MGKRKHRRTKSSPGFINGWRGNSFDSVIEESSIEHDEEEEKQGFSLPGIGINENLKKDEPELLDPQFIMKIQNSTAESSQLGVNSVDFTEEVDDYPIFNPSSLSIPLPNSFSHSSSSGNSSISLRLPASNVSSASHSSTKKTSEGVMDHKNGSGGSEDGDEQLTFPVSDFSQQGSFLGRVRSLIKSPPPVQAMDRSGVEGYDPHRIPSAVFETNRTVEWSVASNESLFSLNLGRSNSFSLEHLFSWGGGDMSKSGELDPLAVHRLATPRASVSDLDHWFQISDVEVDHVLSKVEEEHSEQQTSTDEEIGMPNADQERIIIEVANETNNKEEDDLKQVSGEASLRHEDLKIASKDSEESVKSTNSFAFEVDGTKARDQKHSSSIQKQQLEPEAEPAYNPKARSKSWFDCCSFSSFCLGSPLCTCSFGSCTSCLPCMPSSSCKCCCVRPSFCCFGTRRLGGNRFLCC